MDQIQHGNSKLKDIIAKCKAANMPNDTINNAIKKAAGAGNSENYEEVTYEGYGPSGTAIIVKALTDNKNRTASNVRNAFTKGSGSVGTQGCVSYMFEKKGILVIEKEGCQLSEDDFMMLAIDSGAEDFESEEEVYQITTAPSDFTSVTEKLTAKRNYLFRSRCSNGAKYLCFIGRKRWRKNATIN